MNRGTDAFEQIVDLQRVRAAVASPQERRRLTRVIRELRAQAPAGIPKHRSARLLGISPQALERWTRAGEIPTLRRPGSSRELVDREALVRLLAEVRARRESGERRPMRTAISALREEGRLARRPLPNQSARELRYEYLHGTPENRVRSAVALSQTAHAMAAAAQRRRRTPA